MLFCPFSAYGPMPETGCYGVMGTVMGKCRGALGQPRGIEKLLEGRWKLVKTLGMGRGLGKQLAKACRGGHVEYGHSSQEGHGFPELGAQL